MLFTRLNINMKTLRIISLSLTLTGILFVLTSRYIGSYAIRLGMIIVLLFCLANIKMTYKYLSTKEKVNYLVTVIATVLGFVKPELTMVLIGVLLMFLTVPPYVKCIKSRDYSDVVMIVGNGVGILFSFYCVVNSKAALNTVVVILGLVFVVMGCIGFYDGLDGRKADVDRTRRFENIDEF